MHLRSKNYSNNRLLLILILLVLFVSRNESQTIFTISGLIVDNENGETLPGASVTVNELPGIGVSSNAYGYYALTLTEGSYLIQVSYLGYKSYEYAVNLESNTHLDIQLEPQTTLLDEFEVFPFRSNDNILLNNIGVEKLQVSEIKNIPVFFGEHDIMKTITLTAGVKSIREGNGGLYVRGGNNSHNLVLLDEATVFHASHLLGFFSTFNSDAIKDLTIYKGTAPANFGGRLASVMDVRMKDGNNQKIAVSGGIGLISSRLSVESPIVKDRGSILIAARRTYIDMLLKLSDDPTLNSNTLNFYDLNAKMNFKVNDRNRIYLSAYSGRDAFGVPQRMGLDWGNRTATVRWNHVWYEQLFSNTSLIYSDFDYKVDLFFEPSEFSILSSIKNYHFKHEFQYFLNNENTITFGYDHINHTITPGQLKADENAIVHPIVIQERYGTEQAFYISNEFKPAENWSINFGIRLNMFRLSGPGEFYSYQDGEPVDETSFSSGEVVKSYFFPERRLNITYLINQQQSLKFSYTANTQNIHLITTSSASLPIDIWMMSGPNIKPQSSDFLSLGYFRNFKNDMYQFSAETYIKWLQNQIDLKNGADIMANQHIEGELLFGEGRAYGLELMLKKKYGMLNGWLSYSLSRTELNIPGINDNNWYPARHDITNDLAIVGMLDLSKAVTLSATWVYQTGNAVTFPSGSYVINGVVRYYSSERNGYRMPDYHRLDLGLTWNFRKSEKFHSSLNFSVYNAYARKNAFSIDFEQDPNNPAQTRAVMTYLFTAIPSITYNFNF